MHAQETVCVRACAWAYNNFIHHSLESYTFYRPITNSQTEVHSFYTTSIRCLWYFVPQVDLSKRYGIIRNGVHVIKADPWFKKTQWGALYYQKIEPPFKPPTRRSLVLPQDQTNRISWHSKDDKDMFPNEFKYFWTCQDWLTSDFYPTILHIRCTKVLNDSNCPERSFKIHPVWNIRINARNC